MDTQNVNASSGRKCGHEVAESIGLDSNMKFLRCLSCRAILVMEGGTTIAVPPVRSAG